MIALRNLKWLRPLVKLAGVRNLSSTRPDEALKLEMLEKPVWSWNEWDPLKEVILGKVDGIRIPRLEPCIKSKAPPDTWKWIEDNAGKSHDPEKLKRVSHQVEEFCRILQLEGVTVKRPEVIRWDELGTFKLPFFSEGGQASICPRDGLMVIGDEFIESAMAWRSRYFEMFAYKKLLTEYFHRGAKWTCAPKPTIRDEMFVEDFPFDDVKKRTEMSLDGQYVLNESEIAFDAADALRFGKDIFITLSHNTNRSGVEWLRRHVQQHDINVHSVIFEGLLNCHSDATFLPLKPGVVLVNPEEPFLKVNDEPCGWEFFSKRGWKVVPVPYPVVCQDDLFVSKWIHMNMLSLDDERIILQKGEEPLKRLLISLGMKPIEVDMIDAFGLGGAFHCWTVDVKRIGKLESYF